MPQAVSTTADQERRSGLLVKRRTNNSIPTQRMAASANIYRAVEIMHMGSLRRKKVKISTQIVMSRTMGMESSQNQRLEGVRYVIIYK